MIRNLERWTSLVGLLAGMAGGAAPAQVAADQVSAGHVNESVTAAQAQRNVQQDVPSGTMQSAATQMPVARLSRKAGSVAVIAVTGVEQPADAALNMPLVAGTRIVTAGDGEAEVEFSDGSVLRLTPGSSAELARLDPSAHENSVVLDNGLFYLELRASGSGEFAVSAADLLLTPEENASFRVHVQDGQVETAVLLGSVSVTRSNAYTAQVGAGESLRTDPRNGRRYLLADTVGPETWDAWNERLSQAAQDQESSRTAARNGFAGEQGYGWSDLDAQGQWYSVPGEGQVWQPTLADAAFDPYGFGSWVYGPGGYTWASGYGWGWLPYRCGSWSFFNGFGWGWLPSSGCLSFGFGGGGYGGEGYGGGGFRVRQPPVGWHPPRRPGLGGPQRHPTVPVQLRATDTPAGPPPRRGGEPVRIGGVVATPLPRIGKQVTPQGGSAVGSALLRDFPVSAGTHEPVLGLVPRGVVATPGRPAVWQRVQPAEASNPGVRDTNGGAGVLPGAFAGSGTRRGVSGTALGAESRQPRPTDPPLGANGAPPLGATGQPPLGANGPVPFGAGTANSTRGELLLRHSGSPATTPAIGDRDLRGPLQTHGGEGVVRGGLPVPAPVIPRSVSPPPDPRPAPRMVAPAQAPPPHLSAPTPSAPRAAPTPSAPAAAPVRSK